MISISILNYEYRDFWDVVLKLPEKHQKRLLMFVTGSDRVPAGGMKEMTFKISKMVATISKVNPTKMSASC